jgi:hypothetical protein
MNTAILSAVLPAPLPTTNLIAGNRQAQRVADSVSAALAAVEPFHRAIERRREVRKPYPYPIHLTPLDASGQPEADRTFVVIGKHLAPHGLDFYGRHPLAERRVIASLDGGREGWIGLLLELAWCRFGRHGWYENGGRFLSVVPSPLAGWDGNPRAA